MWRRIVYAIAAFFERSLQESEDRMRHSVEK